MPGIITTLVSGILSLLGKHVDSKDKLNEIQGQIMQLAFQAEQQAQDSLNKAREAYEAEFQYSSHDSIFDKAVDGVNRLVRPLVTYSLIGLVVHSHLAGRPLPPGIWTPVAIVFAFWFGGRVLSQDGLSDSLKSIFKK